jgi:hypothetical protein
MRGEIIDDRFVLEKKLECTWNFDLNLTFPILLLSRAATLRSHQSHGLNFILRYWFLKLAQHHQIPFVIGTFVDGSPRQSTLLKLGYQFFENTLGWQQSTYRSHRPVIVAALDMAKNKNEALAYCEQKLLNINENYIFQGSFPEMRFVRNL